MTDILFKDEYYEINGILMEVHRILGPGFLEIVYKDAIELEFLRRDIVFEREVEFQVPYKDTVLNHRFFADFVVMDEIILEVKAQYGLPDIFQAQVINYLKVSGCKLGILANFGLSSLYSKRFVY